jgi:magnesium transporter
MTGTETPRDVPARPAGLPPLQPPTLRPRPAGAPKATPVRRDRQGAVVDCAVYVDGRRQAPVPPEDALEAARAQGGFVWLGLFEPTEEELTAIGDRYGLHPLAVEDAVYAHQRPKLEHYDDALFMVLKTATYVEHEHLTATSEVVDTARTTSSRSGTGSTPA